LWSGLVLEGFKLSRGVGFDVSFDSEEGLDEFEALFLHDANLDVGSVIHP
jgi:hypothetical protein